MGLVEDQVAGGVAGRVVWAWLLTIPGAALVAAACWVLHGDVTYLTVPHF